MNVEKHWFNRRHLMFKANFTLHGHVNKQNKHFWGTSKPDFYEEKPLHSQKVTSWAALSSSDIIVRLVSEKQAGIWNMF